MRGLVLAVAEVRRPLGGGQDSEITPAFLSSCLNWDQPRMASFNKKHLHYGASAAVADLLQPSLEH